MLLLSRTTVAGYHRPHAHWWHWLAVMSLTAGTVLVEGATPSTLSWGGWDGSVRLVQLASGRALAQLELPPMDRATCGEVCTQRDLAFIGSSSGQIHVLALGKSPKGDSVVSLEFQSGLWAHTGPVTCLAACGDCSLLVSGSIDRTAVLWDLNRCDSGRCGCNNHTNADTIPPHRQHTADIIRTFLTPHFLHHHTTLLSPSLATAPAAARIFF